MAKVKLAVDERTSDLSDAALYCRSKGHAWQEKALSRRRFRELFAQGMSEENEFCPVCGSTLLRIFDVTDGRIVEQKRTYPGGTEYLLPKGSGRLSRSSARVARFARLYKSYA